MKTIKGCIKISVIQKMTDEYLNINVNHRYTLSTYLCKFTDFGKWSRWYKNKITKRLESLELQGFVKQVKSERNGVAWVWC